MKLLSVPYALFIPVLALLLLLPLSAHAALTDGLVGYWTFNGSDIADKIYDRSGQGNHGYFFGVSTSSAKAAGKIGQGVGFRGVGDIAIVQDNASLRPAVITWHIWVKFNALTGFQYVMEKENVPNDAGYGFYTEDATARAYIRIGGAWAFADFGTLLTGQWYAFTATYDGQTLRSYLNGELINSDTEPGTITHTTEVIGFGSSANYNSFLNGNIDDARIYNRVLPASEVRQLYNLGKALSKPPNNLGLVGYWSFDEGTSTVATDFSGNGYPATLGSFGELPRWGTGKRGGAVDFYADSQSAETQPFIGFSSTFTVSVWIFPRTAGENNDGGVVNQANQWSITTCSATADCGSLANTVKFEADAWNGGNEGMWYTNANTIRMGEWNHVAVTYDTGNVANDPVIYINGVVVNVSQTGANPTGSFDELGYTIRMGNGTNNFDGKIDEVRIYNRALSAAEIAALAKSGAVQVAASSKTLAQGSSLSSGLVGHWTFDGSDTIWTSQTAATTIDGSGNGNTGTLTNMNQKSRAEGKLGQALNFDMDGFVVLTGVPALSSIRTYSAWINPRTAGEGGFGTIISTDVTGNSSGNDWGFCSGQGECSSLANTLEFYQFFTGTDGIWHTGANLLTLNQWNHVAVVYDNSATTNDPVFYINGTMVATIENSAPTGAHVSDIDFHVGAYDDSDAFGFDGLIDDVRIYNRALSAKEIKQLYQLGQVTVR